MMRIYGRRILRRCRWDRDGQLMSSVAMTVVLVVGLNEGGVRVFQKLQDLKL